MSDRPVGDGFKYHDFYSSIDKDVGDPVVINSASDLKKLIGKSIPAVSREKLSLLSDRLLNACPFWPESRE
ncbi:hypothetical protein ACMG4L_01455 [Alcanivorax sp. IL1]